MKGVQDQRGGEGGPGPEGRGGGSRTRGEVKGVQDQRGGEGGPGPKGR